MASRDLSVDCLKAAAIAAVVAIHVPYGSHVADPSLRFCVPVFIGLWGYFAEASARRHPDRPLVTYVRDRFVQLFIPYAVWSVVYFLIGPRLKEWNTTPIHTIIGGWLGGGLWAGQYFFIIMFQLLLLFPMLRGSMPEAAGGLWLWGGLGVFAMFELWLVRIRPLALVWDRLPVQWLPYAALGVAVARGWRPPFVLSRSAWTGAGVALLAVAPFEQALLERLGPIRSPYCLMTVYLGSLALLAAALVGHGGASPAGAASRDDHGRPSDASGSEAGAFVSEVFEGIAFIGRRTLPIFVLNPLVIMGLSNLGIEMPTQGLGPQALHGAAVILVIALCIAAIPVFKTLKLGPAIGT